MKQALNLTLQRFLLLLLLSIVVGISQIVAQEEESYNPCPPSLALPGNCLDDSRTCESYSEFPCSEGYCWSSGTTTQNQGIPFNGIVQNKVIDIGGTYTITQNVKFENCTFKMRGDSRINVSPAGSALMKITFVNCEFFGCEEMWQGIVVDASGATGGFYFSFGYNSVEDAHTGLLLDEGVIEQQKPGYSILGNSFRNNHIGVSNLRRDYLSLNAVFTENHFFQTAELAERVGSLENVKMPDYPLAYAGIYSDRAIMLIGVHQHGLANVFSCLANGIVARQGRVSSINNTFENMSQNGIWTAGGRFDAQYCRFRETGDIGILVQGAAFLAYQDTFSGSWWEGIHIGTSSSAFIIHDNEFNMDGARWRVGIFAERPQAAFSSTGRITENYLTLEDNHTGGVSCIRVVDLVDATGEMLISENRLTINSNPALEQPVNGIYADIRDSDNLIVQDNIIEYTVDQIGFGMWLSGDQSISMGHRILNNEISGTSADPDDDPLECCVHSTSVQGIEYCENTVDLSVNGFHFAGVNDIVFRENNINRHEIGLLINVRIEPQHGRGNKWSMDPDACVTAASVSFGNPFFSEFIVPEDNILPWLPPSAKIFPPSGPTTGWFREGQVPLDYCVSEPEPLPRSLTPSENEVVNNTTTLSGAMLWELKRATFTKLLLFPELRPSSSPEETFFNNLVGSRLDSLATVSLQVRDALYLADTSQQTLNDYWADAVLALDTLIAFDEEMDYNDLDNLTETWFEQRDTLLMAFSTNAAAEDTFHIVRNLQILTVLETTLEYNTEISATQSYESAQKILSELRIRRLLNLPIIEELYDAALLLAQDTSLISAAYAVIGLLGPCDQHQYMNWDEGHEHVGERQSKSVAEVWTMRLFPNPTTGLFEVDIPHHQGGTLTVYNTYGQRVVTHRLASNALQASLDLSRHPQGLYWAVLADPAGKVLDSSKISLLR